MPSDADFFPMQVGNRWIFDFTETHIGQTSGLSNTTGEVVWEVAEIGELRQGLRTVRIDVVLSGTRYHAESETTFPRNDTFSYVFERGDGRVVFDGRLDPFDLGPMRMIHPTEPSDTLHFAWEEIRAPFGLFYEFEITLVRGVGLAEMKRGVPFRLGGNWSTWTLRAADLR